jgi:hypothetical protein
MAAQRNRRRRMSEREKPKSRSIFDFDPLAAVSTLTLVDATDLCRASGQQACGDYVCRSPRQSPDDHKILCHSPSSPAPELLLPPHHLGTRVLDNPPTKILKTSKRIKLPGLGPAARANPPAQPTLCMSGISHGQQRSRTYSRRSLDMES